MICVLAMIIFGVLGIFSATHRAYAIEAFDCVFRRVTFRPCNTGFDKKMKAKTVGWLFKHNKTAAGAVHKHFELISWFFTLMFFASMIYSGYSVYNLVVLGTCDPSDPDNCMFNPQNPTGSVCIFEDHDLSTSVETIGNFKKVAGESKPYAYFFGATWCPHCKWEKPIFEKVSDKFSSITTQIIDVDLEPDHSEIVTYKHYSPQGYIPVVIIGGSYYQVGSGEEYGEEEEERNLMALFCKVSNNEAEECSSVQELINQI